jgi:lipid-A-disaccharide synthase
MTKTSSMLVITGEMSGDIHTARILKRMKERMPDLDVYGIGGPLCREQGMETFYDVEDMSVVGFVEVLKRYRFFRQVMDDMIDLAEKRKPDLVLLVDYPGFNLRYAKHLQKLRIKVVYYICPQVWAWNRKRIHTIANLCTRLITIFPFEPALFEGTGLKPDFVGHPLVDESEAALKEPLKELPWSGPLRIACLPGSRSQEIERNLPVILNAATKLGKIRQEASFIIASPSKRITNLIEHTVRMTNRVPERLEVVTGQTRQVLRQAKAAWVASGTATLDAAMMNCPMTVVYRTSFLTYSLAMMLIKIDHIGMVNIVAGREICKELIQKDATPQNLVSAITPLLEDSKARKQMLNDLAEVREKLGSGGDDVKIADIICEEIE